MTKTGDGDAFYQMNGAGEMLVFSAADFEDFREPRPELAPEMEGGLKDVVSLLVKSRWPFRLHATYDESITRMLTVFEQVNREIPFHGLRWFFDHAETISDGNIERVKALGGGVAIQYRMAYQGEYFIERYGAKAAEQTPPITKMLAAGVPVGAGTESLPLLLNLQGKDFVLQTIEAQMRERTNWGALLSPQEHAKVCDAGTQ